MKKGKKNSGRGLPPPFLGNGRKKTFFLQEVFPIRMIYKRRYSKNHFFFTLQSLTVPSPYTSSQLSMLRVETRHLCMDCGSALIIALHGAYYANSQEQCRLSVTHICASRFEV